MASVLLPPSSAHFNALPNIAGSGLAVQASRTNNDFSRLCGIFLKHQVQHIFGMALVHKHFDLEKDEKLVNIGNVAVPVKEESAALPLAPTRWVFVGENIAPYEFVEGSEIDMVKHIDFIREFGKMLHHYGLSEHLGICTVKSITSSSSEPTTEYTSGRANITLPFDVDPNNGSTIEASWQVIEGPVPGVSVFGQCKGRCKTGPNTGHAKKHVNTKT